METCLSIEFHECLDIFDIQLRLKTMKNKNWF